MVKKELGGGDKFEPVSSCGDMADADEAFGEWAVWTFDGAVDFQLPTEAYNLVSFTVARPIIFDLGAAF